MSNNIYIHYGSNKFHPEMVKARNHDRGWNKPAGALWASRIDAKHGRRDWCESEDFHTEKLSSSFKFKLKDNAKVFYIDSADKEGMLPIRSDSITTFIKSYDFEKLIELGYDAVEVSISSDWRLYDGMYGWDCDSIAILNPDVVEVVA